MKKPGAKSILLIVMLVILSITTISFGLNDNEYPYAFAKDKNVLMISSYSPGFATFFDQVEGVKSELDSYSIQLDVEFMDSKRFQTKENYYNFYESMKYKLENTYVYDAVIAADDNALKFFMENQDELFNGIPMVFMGINNIENATIASEDSLVTGIIEAVSIKETIEIARVLLPEAERIVAIVDSTHTGQSDFSTCKQISSNFSDLEFTSIDTSHLDFDQFEMELSSLDKKDIVLLLSLYTDKSGNIISFNDGLKIILDNCPAPVFHIYMHGMGDGLIGGKIISHYEQGVQAGKLALRILSGEPPSEIPVIKNSPNKYIFDYAVMKKFNIRANKLPDEAIIINEKKNIFIDNWPFILAFLLIIFLESIIIHRLRASIKQNRLSESKLLKNNEELEKTSAQLIIKNLKLEDANKNLIEKEKQIHELVYKDSLTGLNNRSKIHIDLTREMQSNTKGDFIAVIFIDIDNFKNVNDSYGHDIGDSVIKSHSQKLMGLSNDKTIVSRFGGDEFLIILSGQKNISDIEKFAGDIVKEFAKPVIVENRIFNMSISMGVSIYPNDGATVTELIKNADLALYHTKNIGKNSYTIFNEHLMLDFEKKIEFQHRIKDAFKKKEFFLNFQPQVDLSTGKLTGFESLIRWIDKKGNYVCPFELVSNAEEMGIIIDIDRWVLSKACAFSKEINSNRETKMIVSVNVSPNELKATDFYEKTIEIIENSGVDPNTICIELTETKAIELFQSGKSVLQALQNYGIRIALDDFGTGYSSLKYFNELPIDIVKIDKSFIDKINPDKYETDLIDSIISIAHRRGIIVIAEGVESKMQMDFLKRKSCDILQGYIYSKPLDKSSAKDFILR